MHLSSLGQTNYCPVLFESVSTLHDLNSSAREEQEFDFKFAWLCWRTDDARLSYRLLLSRSKTPQTHQTLMEALKRSINRKTRRSRRCIYISVAAVFLGIIAIVTPVALVFSRFDHSRGISSTVLVPLYVYPNPGAWKPLYDVLVLLNLV